MEEHINLITLSTKSWHYRMNQFILGNLAPDPETMRNLCPYFWLTILSGLLFFTWGPVKLILLLLWNILKLFAKFFNYLLLLQEKYLMEPMYEKWDRQMREEREFFWREFDAWCEKGGPCQKEIFGGRITFEQDSKMYSWLKKEAEKKGKHWIILRNELIEKRNKRLEEISKKNPPKPRKQFRPIFEEFGEKISAARNSAADKIRRQAKLIKWTKRVTGFIVSTILFVGLYFVLTFLTRGITWIVYIWDGQEIIRFLIVFGEVFGLIAAFLTAGYLIFLLFRGIYYSFNPESWYGKLLKGIFITPFYYLLVKLLWEWLIYGFFVKILAVSFFWNILCVGLIANGCEIFWKGFLGFLGIFGEYFGSAYTDYCPGIEWKQDK